MPTTSESARLRVVGQELERKRISDFEVIVEQDGYRVRGYARPDTAPASKSPWKLRDLLKPRAKSVDANAAPQEWEQTYSTSDIDRLEDSHNAHRAKSGVPDGYATSQVLRVVGAYVEQRGWVLAGVRRTRQVIEIRYRDAHGELQTSTQNYSELYDFCHHMSTARKAEAESLQKM